MSLNVDWSVIGYTADPVPGDPDGVGACAARLKGKQESVDSLVTVLNRIVPGRGGSVFVGDAADQYARKLSHFPEDMKNLSRGLEGACSTLNSWKSSMEYYQGEAHNAYEEARRAVEDWKAAEYGLDDASAAARSAHVAEHLMRARQRIGEDVPKADENDTLDRVRRAERSVAAFRSRVDSAHDSYQHAKKRLDSTSDEYSETARSTASSLQGFLEEMPSASLWERVYYSSAWSVVVKAAEIGGTIFGIAALVLGGGGIIGILAFAFAAIGFLNDLMAFWEKDESGGEFALSFVSFGLAFVGLKGAGKSLSTGLKAFKSGEKGMSVLSRLKLLGKNLRLLGDPTEKGGYLVSHFSTMLGKPNGILPVSKWAGSAKDLAVSSSKRMSKPLLWLKGFGRGVWSSAKATARKTGVSMFFKDPELQLTNWQNDRLADTIAFRSWVQYYGGGVKGALITVRKSPLYETVTSGIRSVAKDEVDALKRQVHNQDKGDAGWRTSVSESLGYLKPLSPIAGSLGSVLSSL